MRITVLALLLIAVSAVGQAKMPADPDAKLDLVLQGGESSLRGTREFLETWNPNLLDEVRGTSLRRMAEGAYDPTLPAVDMELSLDSLARALAGTNKQGGMAGIGLFDDATRADLRLTGKALMTLKNVYFKGIVPGGVTVDDFAINAISRSPEFMGRFLTRLFTSGKRASDILTDPLTRKALQQLAEGNLSSPKGLFALRILTLKLKADDRREQEEQDAAQAQAEKERAESMARR